MIEKQKKRRFFQSRSIRSRLMTILFLMVLIPLLLTTAFGVLMTNRSMEEQTLQRLESVAILKENQIRDWQQLLTASLGYVSPIREDYSKWGIVLTGQNEENGALVVSEARSSLLSKFQNSIVQTQVFEEIALMDLEGRVVLSTNSSQENQILSSREYFREGQKGIFFTPPYNEPSLGRISMAVAMPVRNPQGAIVGVLLGRVYYNQVGEMMTSAAGLGETGETYLVQKSHLLITPSRYPGWTPLTQQLFSNGIVDAVDREQTGSGGYINYAGVPVFGAYRFLPDLKLAILAEQEQSEAQAAARNLLFTNAASGVLALMIALAISIFISRRLSEPMISLAKSAERIASGDLETPIPVEQTDEIGLLANSLQAMVNQLRELIGGLEQKVTQRTQEVERRSLQIQVASEVARDATAAQDLNELLKNSVNLIRDRFGFDHAGIFLVDNLGKFAVLSAATGEAGQKMLERGHKLGVGETGIVGYVTSTGEPRIALDVGVDAVHFRNPFLPNTRSEMALPLKSASQVIGALDVQSNKATAFDQSDINVLQILADQLAVAIENARLFDSMSSALAELQAAQQQFTQESWKRFTSQSSRPKGYRARGAAIEAVSPTDVRPVDEVGFASIPLKIRDQVVGTIDLRFGEEENVDQLLDTVEEIASRLSLVLESARLLEETQLRSEQLNLLQDITATAAAHIQMQDLADNVTQKVREGFDLTGCSILLFDSEHQKGTVVATSEAPEAGGKIIPGQRLPVSGCGFFDEIIETEKTLVAYRAADDSRSGELKDYLNQQAVTTLVLVPLVLRGTVEGAILLSTADPERRFTEDDLRLFDQIGLQLSVSVDVARLFNITEETAMRERLLGEIATRMRESLDPENVVQVAAREIRRALDLEDVTVRLDLGGKSAAVSPAKKGSRIN